VTADRATFGLGELLCRRKPGRRQRPQETRRCDVCGAEFRCSRRSRQRRCSGACAAQAEKRWREARRAELAQEQAGEEQTDQVVQTEQTLEHLLGWFRAHPHAATTSVRVARLLHRPVAEIHRALTEAGQAGWLELRDGEWRLPG